MSCDALPAPLYSWTFIKELLVKLLVDHKEGFEALKQHQDALLSLAYDPDESCLLGQYCLRIALLIFSDPWERWLRLQEEPLPWAMADVLQVLQSGWPIFGLLGLVAYKLSRDGAGKDVCDQTTESFRIRYEEVMLEGKEVPFSRDVENTAVELLQHLEQNRTLGPMSRACLLGAGLPLLGYGASISCASQRDLRTNIFLQKLVQDYEEVFLRPAAHHSACLVNFHRRPCTTAKLPSLANLLSSGMWAAESLHLLQRLSIAFSDALTGLSQGSLEVDERKVLVSVDPLEDNFHGYGLPSFTSHLWAESDNFEVHPGLSCPDLMVARDSLPAVPFLGAIIYVDHEAGIGPGRDAGKLSEVLAKYKVIYLGVLEPLAATKCLSRYGTPLAQRSRVCAKIFDARASEPPPNNLKLVYVPYASTSFAARSQTPMDLLVPKYTEKTRFLAYMAYACVDHRELLFDLLVQRAASAGIEAPVALSRCTGFRSRHRRQLRNHTRGVAMSFLDEAIELLRPYKFALVFENKLVPGYVTEKIVNAFLAGCIPIYWGSRSVLEIFNPEAFIYANDIQAPGLSDYEPMDPLTNLERVADYVVQVAQDEETLEHMASAPALNHERLYRFFSWHRVVRQERPGLEALPTRLSASLPRLQRRVLCASGWRMCTADVKCGIGLILCLLGLQMLLARIVVIQPLLTCAVMLGIILAFIGISALVDSRSTEIEAVEDEKTLS
eukprot:symbB.v1.2.002741.t2/scaffold146.1/size298692/22